MAADSKKRFTEFLKFSYKFGGYYDILLGIALIFGEVTANILNIQLVEPMLVARTLGLFLILVGYYLVYTANNATNYLFIGIGSSFIRMTFSILVIFDWSNLEYIYKIFGFTDAITAMMILYPMYKMKGILSKND